MGKRISWRRKKREAQRVEPRGMPRLKDRPLYTDSSASDLTQDEDDILGLWKTADKVKAENDRLDLEYKATKARARALRRQVRKAEGLPLLTDVKSYFSRFTSRFTRLFSRIKIPLPDKLKPHRRKLMYGGSALVLVLLIGLVLGGVFKGSGPPSGNGNDVLGEESAAKADFRVLLPNGSVTDTESGKTLYDAEHKVASFTDKIDTLPITVSQQKLPPAFKDDPQGQLEKFAKDIYATEILKNNDAKAYLGTNIRGPQTVIFVRDELLIFLKSDTRIAKQSWEEYINSLQ